MRFTRHGWVLCCIVVFGSLSPAYSDVFGSGSNEFTIDFVTITSNPSSASDPVPYDFRVGKYEITNLQWEKFEAEYGTPKGNPITAYNDPVYRYWPGDQKPVSYISWYEAAQFVNWLNMDSGYPPAYKFTGTALTDNYTWAEWAPGDPGYNPENPFRSSLARYFLPTAIEWKKAAFWNGTTHQQYATPDGTIPEHMVDANYDNPATALEEKVWNVDGGSEELNGSYNMSGNLCEWCEDLPWWISNPSGVHRITCGSSFWVYDYAFGLEYSDNDYEVIYAEAHNRGFRVFSYSAPPESPVAEAQHWNLY